MNYILEDARKRRWDAGVKATPNKHLQVVVIATPESRTETLKEAEANQIKMGETIIKNSKSESISVIKYIKTEQLQVSMRP